MRIEAEVFRIEMRRPFRIAHGTSATRQTVLVYLYGEREELVGHGEGALPPYYPSTAGASLKWLNEVALLGSAEAWQASFARTPPEASAGRVALEIALQDLRAQEAGKPIWRLWGLDPARMPPCWRTLSIPADEKELDEMLDEAISRGSRRIKLKTGSGDPGWDEHCMRRARKRSIRIGLDANEGWSPEGAARILSRVAECDFAFVEQPVPRVAGCWRELRSRLQELKIPPLIADESLQTEDDFDALKGLVEGVNIKLLKAGGLEPARRWITRARQMHMKVMVGTMVETGIGRTAAAQLAPLADWLDVDPPESIPAAPLIGFEIEEDRLILAERPGLGLRRASP